MACYTATRPLDPRDPQCRPSDLAATVVILNDSREISDPAKPQFGEEETFLDQRGIRRVHIPVPLGGWPTTDDIRLFLETATDTGDQPVLVHCARAFAGRDVCRRVSDVDPGI